MSTFFATPSALLGWLKAIAANHIVAAPKTEGPVVLFKHWSADELGACSDVNTLLRRSTMSPKENVIPKSEVLYHFKGTKDELDLSKIHQELEVPTDVHSTVLFGGRPCDARGFLELDKPYIQGPFVDPYYKARRDLLCIVTQACSNALSTCFCNWIGSHPATTDGSDILFTPIGEGFLFVAVTEKGTALLEKSGFSAASDDHIAAATKVHEKTRSELAPDSDYKNVPEKVASRFNDEAFWLKETEKCLSCGACTFLCPTCQCFNITDEGNQLVGKRLRSWDGCMNPNFTMEASGHNPRMDRAKRYRNRIGHKFSYGRKDKDFSCVGCGRCVRSCPAHLDIRTVVRNAVEGANLKGEE